MNIAVNSPTWDNYAALHASVTALCQIELWQQVLPHVHGDVGDFGCGTARIAPFLVNVTNVDSYTGIDASKAMVSIAGEMAKQWANKKIILVESPIEQYQGQPFSSAISLNSYYAWRDPPTILAAIYRLLNTGGAFVLATPNPALDMAKIVEAAWKELWAHHYFEQCSRTNLKLAK
ncbi:MAG: class I SAM-dependent methyltransferase [Candidatus Competibacteraceae bacterium]|nr:class I SAM-dependent methyltransferase [Candidatus Competibacteraceae bacterium]